MPSTIINLNYFLPKKDCITYIIFFTFAAMKTNQKQRKNSSSSRQNKRSFLSLLKRFYSISRNNFIFDVFQYLKTENEKLQIIYANIRV
jgi:hypothetical protein